MFFSSKEHTLHGNSPTEKNKEDEEGVEKTKALRGGASGRARSKNKSGGYVYDGQYLIPQRRSGWRCPACLRESVDARRVCGFCLAVEPGVLPVKQVNQKKGDANDKANDYGVLHTCMGPGVSEVSSARTLLLPHGRCYRITATNGIASTVKPQMDMKIFTTNGDGPKEGEEEEEEEEEKDDKVKEEMTEGHATHVRGYQRRKPKYTHFVSIPIGKDAAVQPNATALLEEMRRRCVNSSTMVTEDIFTTAPRMHITLLMLSLPTDDAVALALNCMQALETELQVWRKTYRGETNHDDGRPQIHLGGLHVMNGRNRNAKKADVLYMGTADPSSKATLEALQRLVWKSFAELIANDPDELERNKLLHMTLMNTKWRGRGGLEDAAKGSSKAPSRHSPRVAFDATHILQEFGQASLFGGDADGAIALQCVELNALNYDSKLQCYRCERAIAF